MFLLAACLVAVSASAQITFKLKPILKTGDDAPVPSLLSSVGQASFNSQGQVAFIGDGGLFLKSGDKLQALAGPGEAAPDSGTFLQINSPSINSRGDVVFEGATTQNGGLFLFSQGRITLLLPDGVVSTTGDVVFPTQPVINDSGVVAFVNNGIPDFPLFGQGIFQFADGVVTKIAADGDAAPGQETLAEPFLPTNGLFLASGNSVTKIIASGDATAHGGIFFDVQGSPSINDAGQVA